MLAAIGAAMAVVAVVYTCGLVWVLITSLGLFFGGPGPSRASTAVIGLVAALPALACLFVVVKRLVAHVHYTRAWWREPSSVSDEPEKHWLGPRTTLVIVTIMCLGFLAFARLVFEYARIQGAIDEGLYLYAARLAMAGQVPYRDFYFDQAPLLPYAFGLALSPFAYNEVAARVFAIACTLLAMLVSFFAAARIGGRLAGVLAFALLVTCVDFTSELSGGVQSNGGLTALVVALVALALTYNRLGAALLLGCLAAGLRQSFIPLPLVIACYVGLVRGRPWLALVGGILPVVLVYGIPLVVGGETAVLAFLRPLRTPYVMRAASTTSLDQMFSAIRDTLLQVTTAYFPFLLAAGPLAYLAIRRGHPRVRLLLTLAASCAILLIADLLPSEANARYPVTLLPLAAVLGAVSLVAVLDRAQPDVRAAVLAGLILILTISPAIAYRGTNFVDLYASKPPLRRFLAAADYVRANAPPNATLVTLETPFASQTGLRLAHGLEAGSWGIYTNISPARAQHLGVLTYPMLADMVEQGAGDVVIESDRYGFVNNYVSNEDQKHRIQDALKSRYELVETFGSVSDWGDVRVWLKRR
jgi:hypothetical protein